MEDFGLNCSLFWSYQLAEQWYRNITRNREDAKLFIADRTLPVSDKALGSNVTGSTH